MPITRDTHSLNPLLSMILTTRKISWFYNAYTSHVT